MASKGDKLELNLNEETRKLEIRTGGLAYTLSLLDPSSISEEPKVPNSRASSEDCGCRHRVEEERSRLQKKSPITWRWASRIRLSTWRPKATWTRCASRYRSEPGLTEEHGYRPVAVLAGLPERHRQSPGRNRSDRPYSDYPVKFTFGIAGGNGQVVYLLAPRIESE